MGRGVAWTDIECAHLARARNNATQDAVVGREQTSAAFCKKVFELFCTLRTGDATEKQYEGRNIKSARCKFEAISADVSKFRTSLRSVSMFQPTGTTSDQNLSLAIALHLKKRTQVCYEAKNYPHNQWLHRLAYNELKFLPKFAYDHSETVVSDANEIENDDANTNTNDDEDDYEGRDSTDVTHVDYNVSNTSSGNTTAVPPTSTPESSLKRKAEDISTVGRKRSKMEIVRQRQTEAAIRNAASIAASLKRKTELMEEQNALTAFSINECTTEQEKAERIEFMKLTIMAHIHRLRTAVSSLGLPTPNTVLPSRPEVLPPTPAKTATPPVQHTHISGPPTPPPLPSNH